MRLVNSAALVWALLSLALELCAAPVRKPLGPPAYKLRDLRVWARDAATRIVVDANTKMFTSGVLHNPERFYFDLENTLPSGAKFRTIAGAGVVKKVRMALSPANLIRVVVDLNGAADFETSQLVNPARIVIEVRPIGAPKLEPKPEPKLDIAAPQVSESKKGKAPILVAAVSPVVAAPPLPRRHLKAFVPPPPPVFPKAALIAPAKLDAPKVAREAWLAQLPPPPGWTMPRVLPPAKAKKAVVASRIKNNKKLAPNTSGKAPAEVAKVESPPLNPLLVPDHVDVEVGQPASGVEQTLTRALGLKLRRVVLDAGHGGKDVGTISPHGMFEKDLVLDVTRRLGRLVEEHLGSEVVYTRADDTFIPLGERTAIANREKADLFLSIHANSARSGSAAGFETYYLNVSAPKADMEVAARENASSERTIADLTDLVKQITLSDKLDESRQFAEHVHDATYPLALRTIGTVRDRGIKKAPFMVLIGARMPSVLVEIGFMTNPAEEANMRKADYRQKIAEALFRGVASYADTLSHFVVADDSARSASSEAGN